MRKSILFTQLIAMGLCAMNTFAQAPRLTNIVFTKNGIPTTQIGYGFVTVELVFDKTMNTNVNPVIHFSLAQNYGLTFPAQGNWQTSTLWQAQAAITNLVPSTSDGEYLFRISGAQDSTGTAMNPTFSIDINNTTLFICRTGEASLSTNSLLFGTTPQGIAKDMRFVVYNTSCADLRVTNSSIFSPFSLINLSLPNTIPANDSLVLTVRFLPAQRAQFVDSLMLRTNDRIQADHYVHLSGTSVGPSMVTSPTDTLDFGKVRLDSSAARTVIIHNKQASDTSLSDILRVTQISTTNSSVFKTNVSSLIVTPGNTGSFTVTFTPQQAIKYEGHFLSLVHNDLANTPYSIYLRGDAQDETSPDQVRNLQANWSGSNGFTRADSLFICWDNPNDPSGIARVWWKFDTKSSPPADGADTGIGGGSAVPALQNSRFCANLPLRGRLTSGRWHCYVWLVDGRGNSGYRNAEQIIFTYDVNPPGRPTLVSQSIPGTTWFGSTALFNITIAILPDLQRGFPDAAEMRWKFKKSPNEASDFHSRAIFNSLQISSATVNIPFTSTALCGDDSVYFWLADSAGNSNHLNYSLARYRFDICAPEIIHSSSTSSQPSASPITISANIIDGGPIRAIFYYRRGGSSEFNSMQMFPNGEIYQATISAESVTSQGIDYFIEAVDSVNNLTSRKPDSGLFSIQVTVDGQGVQNPAIQPDGSAQSAYRLISMPIDLDDKNPRTVLEDDVSGYDNTKWRLFDWRNGWLEYPNTANFSPGKALFLIVKDSGKRIDSGPGKSNITNQAFSIALEPGWNLIGNPFNFTIPVEKSRLKSNGQNPPLRSYTGQWSNPSSVVQIQPFEGYALFNNLNSVDSLFVNPDLSSSTTAAQKKSTLLRERFQWSINIIAQCQDSRDGDNILAIDASASSGWDELDQPEPPPIGEYVMVYFPHPEWNTLTKLFSTDARPKPMDGDIWKFEVKSNIRGVVSLTFNGLPEVPRDFEIWLVDVALQITQNLRMNQHYSFIPLQENRAKEFQLVIGRSDFISEETELTRAIPHSFVLSQNFPNPFNPVTTIRYGIPETGRVTLKVFNLLGEEVITLVNDELKSPGYYIAAWDGRGNGGIPIAGGIYVYQIRVNNVSISKRMVMLR